VKERIGNNNKWHSGMRLYGNSVTAGMVGGINHQRGDSSINNGVNNEGDCLGESAYQ